MRKLTAHAGWENDAVIGTVCIEEIRGKEKFSFEYEPKWLMQHENLILDPNLFNRPGLQYVPQSKEVFGFLSDISPDRWGRKLIQRHFAEAESVNGSQPSIRRRVLESDYICGVSDFTRQGGIRLSENGHFLSDVEPAVPPVTKLRELEHAAAMLERHEGNVEKWLSQLMNPGSSLGGARPKANVQNTDGSLWIAKFPSKNDDIDVGAWEMVVQLKLLRILVVCMSEKYLLIFPTTTSTASSSFRMDRIVDTRNAFLSSSLNTSKVSESPIRVFVICWEVSFE